MIKTINSLGIKSANMDEVFDKQKEIVNKLSKIQLYKESEEENILPDAGYDSIKTAKILNKELISLRYVDNDTWNTVYYTINIPEGATTFNSVLSDTGFSHFSYIEKLYIPSTLTSLGGITIKPTDIYYNGTKTDWIKITFDSTTTKYIAGSTIHYSNGISEVLS